MNTVLSFPAANPFADNTEPSADNPYQLIDFGHIGSLTVKRLDLLHPPVGGNKHYKLKYNLIEARRQGRTQLLSFGGAYSNHIHALAHAAHEQGFASVGIIRGDELASQPLNPTLTDAKRLGMQLEFVSRAAYRDKHSDGFLAQLRQRYPNAYIIPEGGSNQLAVQGCEQILSAVDRHMFAGIACAVGTGATLAGLINASGWQQQVIGLAAVKGGFLPAAIRQWLANESRLHVEHEQRLHAGQKTSKNNWQLIDEDRFGGYGRYDDELIDFIDEMRVQHNLPLEPIYTGKAMYRLLEMMRVGDAPRHRMLFIHTGGLQGYRAIDED